MPSVSLGQGGAVSVSDGFDMGAFYGGATLSTGCARMRL